MKKIYILTAAILLSIPSFADGVTNGFSEAGDYVYSYTPYIQILGYVLSAIIGIVGAVSVYFAFISNKQGMTKRILTWGCACLAMLCMTTALPQFFDYQESGYNDGGSDDGGGNGKWAGGDDYQPINPEIPGFPDSRWQADPRFVTPYDDGEISPRLYEMESIVAS